MPLLLRKIRRAKWYKNAEVPWLPQGELQADALSDLSTKDNELSVWLIHDNKLNLNQVLAALAANLDTVSNFDYALVDEQRVAGIGIKIAESKGNLLDPDVNALHRNLSELTAAKLMELASALQSHADILRLLPYQVGALIREAVQQGRIELGKLKPAIQSGLGSGSPST